MKTSVKTSGVVGRNYGGITYHKKYEPMEISVAQYAKLAEWADKMVVAANRMLARGGNAEIINLRALIVAFEQFDELSIKSQRIKSDADKLAEHYGKKNPMKPGGCP